MHFVLIFRSKWGQTRLAARIVQRSEFRETREAKKKILKGGSCSNSLSFLRFVSFYYYFRVSGLNNYTRQTEVKSVGVEGG